MTRLPVFVLVLALILAQGCSHTTEHTLLAPPPRSSSTPRDCSVGVARLVDEQGVDYALDLRDFLRERGPCKEVHVVSDATSDQAELVVSGHVRGKLQPQQTPEHAAGTIALIGGAEGVGIGAMAFILGSVIKPDASLSAADKQSAQSTADAFATIGPVMMAVGAAVFAAGVYDYVDNAGARQISVDPLEADVEITRRGETAARLSLRDTVDGRAPPRERTPAENNADAFGSIQRELLGRIFEHIAAKLDELASAGHATAP